VLFDILGEIADIETFARGPSIREPPRLRKLYGRGRWRKAQGLCEAQIHWYEASGIGRKEFKIKRFID